MKCCLLLLLVLLSLGTAHGGQWEDSQRLKKVSNAYDLKAVVTVSGSVQRIFEMKPHDSPSKGYHMILKTPQETLNVHLGPAWYLKKLGDAIAVGDEVEVTGAMTKDLVAEGNTKIRSLRAAEIKKNAVTVLKLRERDGQPLWRGF